MSEWLLYSIHYSPVLVSCQVTVVRYDWSKFLYTIVVRYSAASGEKCEEICFFSEVKSTTHSLAAYIFGIE